MRNQPKARMKSEFSEGEIKLAPTLNKSALRPNLYIIFYLRISPYYKLSEYFFKNCLIFRDL